MAVRLKQMVLLVLGWATSHATVIIDASTLGPAFDGIGQAPEQRHRVLD